ncbi:MAG: peptide chain release factor 2 [Bacilli bacterium]|nr:peptide chain release factor 2 [Bacilli bacterium]
MEIYELLNIYNDLNKKIEDYGGLFDSESKEKRLEELEKKVNEPNFWNDKKNSEKIIDELNTIKNNLNNVKNLRTKIKDNIDIIKSLKEENDVEIKELVEQEIDEINIKLKELEILLLLDGPYDKLGAIMEIHPGAGGTESQDWALMLYRMYTRYFEKKNYKYEVIEYQNGEEAGIKNVTILIHGINVYGYLKCEKGVHRLVRISPFDSNKRRHTSFASVDVSPLFVDNDINIDINESDLKIDVYRSSGKGGQGVNTTDSAVRITHIPTKIVVTCQNERSQIKNKEIALNVLKNKLYNLELEKKEKQLKDIKGELSKIDFGSQIRSYVMHPYSLVKDNRTNTEVTDVKSVLDGDIDIFINDNLSRR